jgi:hypothetical protein
MEMEAVLGAETAVSTNNQEHVTVTRQQQLWLKAKRSQPVPKHKESHQ